MVEKQAALRHDLESRSLKGDLVKAMMGISPISYSAAHILDSEPDAPTNKPVARLAIYALTRRAPGLKLFDIKCA